MYFLEKVALQYGLGEYKEAFEQADWVFNNSNDKGYEIIHLDASLARGELLFRLGRANELKKSVCINAIIGKTNFREGSIST